MSCDIISQAILLVRYSKPSRAVEAVVLEAVWQNDGRDDEGSTKTDITLGVSGVSLFIIS